MIAWIILGVVVMVGSFVIYNLLGQISELEKAVAKVTQVEDDALSVYDFFLKLFSNTLREMEDIDRRGAFKADDEVGFIFNTLLESIKHVKFQIEKLAEESDSFSYNNDDGEQGQ